MGRAIGTEAMGAYDVSRAMGQGQRPFRYGDGIFYRPGWLQVFEPEEGELSKQWPFLIAHVANTANESGFFAPEHAAWTVWSGLGELESKMLAIRLETAGGLTRIDDRWYVVGWRRNTDTRGSRR